MDFLHLKASLTVKETAEMFNFVILFYISTRKVCGILISATHSTFWYLEITMAILAGTQLYLTKASILVILNIFSYEY